MMVCDVGGDVSVFLFLFLNSVFLVCLQQDKEMPIPHRAANVRLKTVNFMETKNTMVTALTVSKVTNQTSCTQILILHQHQTIFIKTAEHEMLTSYQCMFN